MVIVDTSEGSDDEEKEEESDNEADFTRAKPPLIPPPVVQTSRRRPKQLNSLTADAFHIINHGFVHHPEFVNSSSLDGKHDQEIMEKFGKETFGEKNTVLDINSMSCCYLPAHECGVYFTCHSPADPACWDSCVVIILVKTEGLSVEYVRSGPTFRGLLDASRLHSNREVEDAIVSLKPEKNVYVEELHVGDIVCILPSTLHRFFLRPGYCQTPHVRVQTYVEVICGYKGKCPPAEININQYPSGLEDDDYVVPLLFPVDRFSPSMEAFVLQACFHVPLVIECVEVDIDMDGFTSMRKFEVAEDKLLALLDKEREFFNFEDVEKARIKLLQYTRIGNDRTLSVQSLWTLIDWITQIRNEPEIFFYELQLIGQLERPPMDRALRLLGQIFHRPLPEIRSQDRSTIVNNLFVFIFTNFQFYIDQGEMEAWIQEMKHKGANQSTRLIYSKLCKLTNTFTSSVANNTDKLPANLGVKVSSSFTTTGRCACKGMVCNKASECINFKSQEFCNESNCFIVGGGENCTNQTALLESMGRSVQACWSGDHSLGNGLYCNKYVTAGTRLVEMTGQWLEKKPAKNDQLYLYKYNLDKKVYGTNHLYLNSSQIGNIGRFVNARCVPNAQFENWTSERGLHVIVVSTRDIFKGMTVTVDYGDEYTFSNQCCCGSLQCVEMVDFFWT